MAPAPAPQNEALQLLEDALGDLEIGQVSLTAIAMRAARIARLLNEADEDAIFRFEISGYPTAADGIPAESWRLAGLAKRQYSERIASGETKVRAYTEAIEVLQTSLASAQAQMPTLDAGDAFQRLGKIGIPTQVKTLTA